ncbi:YfbK domain-containing protein [Myxococcus landrumensis]|uniref:von Willebrand factor type A domain-containing protein n=1 Tax=Myxococcus landrumensis TaxID=2813577 RepID=A0ABX7N3B8_9BACT|nr:von Willebrand factor type A domain-containing protein [Myxococcus landrumus]QSQ12981.1 von Willebrand factor type A domain-containing protein [Myxococcus landrumus]
MKTAFLRYLCGVLLCLASSAWAREGSVSGTVLQAQGQQPLSGVKVSAQSPVLPAPRSVVTDARGHYVLASLPVGLYTLRFEKESFQPVTRTDVRVEAGQALALKVELASVGTGAVAHSFSPLAPLAPPQRWESDGIAWMATARSGDIRDRAPPWVLPQESPLSTNLTNSSVAIPTSKLLRDSDTRGFGVNPTIDTEEERISTYPLRVSTASYVLTKGYLERDTLPPEESVRVEDFVNSFDLGDPGDVVGPFKVQVEGYPSPSRKGYHVVRVSLSSLEAFSDVGVQLEFDRRVVARYRLVGYEQTSATPEPLDDDAEPEAVPMKSGASVTAVYEVKLIGPGISFATVRVLYEFGENTNWRRAYKYLPSSTLRSSSARAAPETRLAYVAAAFAEKLRGSHWTRSLDWARLHALWQDIGAPLTSRPDVVELGALIKKAGSLDHRKDREGSLSNLDPDASPITGK